jgi:hypothetical protein
MPVDAMSRDEPVAARGPRRVLVMGARIIAHGTGTRRSFHGRAARSILGRSKRSEGRVSARQDVRAGPASRMSPQESLD